MPIICDKAMAISQNMRHSTNVFLSNSLPPVLLVTFFIRRNTMERGTMPPGRGTAGAVTRLFKSPSILRNVIGDSLMDVWIIGDLILSPWQGYTLIGVILVTIALAVWIIRDIGNL